VVTWRPGESVVGHNLLDAVEEIIEAVATS
jgi:hypothetical protein